MADQARTIRIPVHMVEVINKLARAQRQMLRDLGREGTPQELAKELDLTPEKVIEVQKYGREPISLHTPLGEDGHSEFGDLIEDSDAVVPADAVSFILLQEQLQSVLDTLSEREAGVSRCGSGSPTVSRRRWRRSARFTASRASGSVRSSPRRCPSYGTRHARRSYATSSTDSPLATSSGSPTKPDRPRRSPGWTSMATPRTRTGTPTRRPTRVSSSALSRRCGPG